MENTNTVNLSKYKKIINKLKDLGFNDFYQAGSINKFHELNLVMTDESKNIDYWICKSFGEFYIAYRKGIGDYKAKQHRVECKNQTEVCNKFTELVSI